MTMIIRGTVTAVSDTQQTVVTNAPTPKFHTVKLSGFFLDGERPTTIRCPICATVNNAAGVEDGVRAILMEFLRLTRHWGKT